MLDDDDDDDDDDEDDDEDDAPNLKLWITDPLTNPHTDRGRCIYRI